MRVGHGRAIRFHSALLAVAVLCLTSCSLSGDGGQEEGEGSKQAGSASARTIRLSVMTNENGMSAKVLQAIASGFMKENPNIKVDFSVPGLEYENIMKVKMASNELPDIFSTHGWAKKRYGQYLEDLRDEAWVSRLDDTIRPVVTDENGKVYALPIDQDKSGPVYNKEVLERYGVEVPTTWNELLEAAEIIRTKSNGEVVPIHIGGADAWPIGQFFDFFGTALFISPENNEAGRLSDGTFDWHSFDRLPRMLLELQSKGYLNKDVLTDTYKGSAAAFAEGKAAFALHGPSFILEARAIRPGIRVGLMPIPSVVAGDAPTFAGGEKTTWGIWKDSPNKEAARKFLAFYARPENAAKVATSHSLLPALSDVPVDAGSLTDDYKKYGHIRVFPYFDREYLPNGMWNVMYTNGQDMLAGIITPSEFSENMKREYERLRAARQ